MLARRRPSGLQLHSAHQSAHPAARARRRRGATQRPACRRPSGCHRTSGCHRAIDRPVFRVVQAFLFEFSNLFDSSTSLLSTVESEELHATDLTATRTAVVGLHAWPALPGPLKAAARVRRVTGG